MIKYFHRKFEFFISKFHNLTLFCFSGTIIFGLWQRGQKFKDSLLVKVPLRCPWPALINLMFQDINFLNFKIWHSHLAVLAIQIYLVCVWELILILVYLNMNILLIKVIYFFGLGQCSFFRYLCGKKKKK